ncbi:MAG: hypothetical protein KDC84_16360, partial [Crocinitomicaceae bacterium]|nr:hypothetical protein [Crocinitomicaceae bacterium]
MKKIVQILVLAKLTACSTEGVKSDAEADAQTKEDSVQIDTNQLADENMDIKIDSTSSEKEFPNGLRIVWEQKLGAERLETGDVIKLDYV